MWISLSNIWAWGRKNIVYKKACICIWPYNVVTCNIVVTWTNDRPNDGYTLFYKLSRFSCFHVGHVGFSCQGWQVTQSTYGLPILIKAKIVYRSQCLIQNLDFFWRLYIFISNVVLLIIIYINFYRIFLCYHVKIVFWSLHNHYYIIITNYILLLLWSFSRT